MSTISGSNEVLGEEVENENRISIETDVDNPVVIDLTDQGVILEISFTIRDNYYSKFGTFLIVVILIMMCTIAVVTV